MDKLQITWENLSECMVEGLSKKHAGTKLKLQGMAIVDKGTQIELESETLLRVLCVRWSEAVLKEKGDIAIIWKGYTCYLETGEIFKLLP